MGGRSGRDTVPSPPARESHQRDRLVLWNKSQKSPGTFFKKSHRSGGLLRCCLTIADASVGHFGHIYFRLFFLCIVNRRRMGMERWKKIRQGNKNVAEHGACCCTNLALGSLARLFGSFFLLFPPFLVWSGVGLVVFGVFDIHTLPPLYLRYGRYYMVGDSAVAPASSCRSGLPDFGLVF